MNVLQRIETLLLRVVVGLSRMLGPVHASNLGGFLARSAGPRLPVSRVAHRNLQIAMPELDAAARARIVRKAWDNLGRTIAELPHVAALGPTADGPGWEIEGLTHMAPLLADRARFILASGHFANWEVLFPAARFYGLNFAGFYRAAANSGVDRLLMQLRNPVGRARGLMFAKGAPGARGALAHLRDGGALGMLMDQKMNDGVPATLFGRTAMTASAMASMALRYRCPVLPVHVERLGPARFLVVLDAAFDLPDTGNRPDDVLALTQAVNDRLESWIRARPGEWLLMHRRWPKAEYAAGQRHA